MTTPTAPSLPAGVVAAWQAALGAEHAAVYGYGTLGPHLPGGQQSTARAYGSAHLTLRDAVIAAMRTAGLDPARSRADYGTGVVSSPAAARRLALRLEDDAASAWRYLVARCVAEHGPAGLRAGAVATLSASAVRALTWRSALTPSAPFEAFPGI